MKLDVACTMSAAQFSTLSMLLFSFFLATLHLQSSALTPNKTPLIRTARKQQHTKHDFRTIPRYAHIGSVGKDDDELQQEQMTLLQQALYQQEMNTQTESSSWLDNNRISNFPFECTSCGKCCRTIGNVYMSPEEIMAASNYLNLTSVEFIKTYASHTFGTFDTVTDSEEDGIKSNAFNNDGTDKEVPWILLANKENKDNAQREDPACIFLDLDTNHCQIYAARPIQCSTYPFWTRIMDSESLWNDEIRRRDDDDTYDDWFPFPPWTPESGGCEGMRPIGTSERSNKDVENDVNAKEELGSIPIKDALEQLALYERNDRRLPRGLPQVPVNRQHTEG